MKRFLRMVALTLLSIALTGCMIPLPPHGARTESHVVGERLGKNGQTAETITQRRRFIYGRWLLHPTSTFDEWQGHVRSTYFLQDAAHTNKTELSFLADNDYYGWTHFVAIPDTEYWWGFTPVHFGTNEMDSIAVFNTSGFKHIRPMPSLSGTKIEQDGRVLEFHGTNGWIYRILDDEFVPNSALK
jgi:hypothetical protein